MKLFPIDLVGFFAYTGSVLPAERARRKQACVFRTEKTAPQSNADREKGAVKMSDRAIIRAVCISEKKGQQKHPTDVIRLRPEHGIDGDAHAGNWHRQVSLLGKESVDRLQEKISIRLFPGAFAENILCEGMDLYRLPVGTRLRIGTALCEVTQIGKECHADCAIRRQAGDCVMPREGIFAIVLEEGEAKAGDELRIVE